MVFNRLPQELIEYMFTMVNPPLADSLPRVCKEWDECKEKVLERTWWALKDSVVKEGYGALKTRMDTIELEGKNKDKYVTLFQKLYQHSNPTSNKPPAIMETVAYFLAQEEADRALEVFWSLVCEARVSVVDPSFVFSSLMKASPDLSAGEIRTFINQEENKAKLKEIEHLDLISRGLKKLPPEIAAFSGLKTLWLGGNRLKEIPVEIGKLCQLEELDLDENHLSDLPPEIEKLVDLRVLNIASNNLKTLPKQIGSLTHLRRLNCCNNQLTMVPKELGDLEKLEKLYLAENQLSELPTELRNLRSLTRFELERNWLSASTLAREILDLNPSGLDDQREQDEEGVFS